MLALLLSPLVARAEVCDQLRQFCGYARGGGASATGAPTRGSKVRINPAAVPTEKGFGLESIIYGGEADFALVKGFGRVGAGISPSNSEETFFGPPSIEYEPDYLERKYNYTKYKSQKYSAAGAVGLWRNKKQGIKRVELNIGVLGKYNTKTKKYMGGGGLNGSLGPITFGASRYQDQTQYDDEFTNFPVTTTVTTNYHVNNLSVGLFLNSLALDYSILRMDQPTESTTTLITATLLLKRVMLTYSHRSEKSDRPVLIEGTTTVDYTVKNKIENFYGVQVNLGKYLMLGAFYNYYLLREYSLGATLFF